MCLGRRSGKTCLEEWLAAHELIRGGRVGWFAPTYKMLMDAWRELSTMLGDFVKRNESEKRMESPRTGGVIECWSLDSVDAGRGRKYSRVILDEAALVPRLEEVWNAAIRPTLTDLEGDAWFGSTPKGMNYYHTLFQRGGREPGWSSWQMPSSCNPYLPPEAIEEARKELPSIVFRQEYLAEFVVGAGARIDRGWLRVGEPPDGLHVVMGVDLAISTKAEADYSSCVVVGEERMGDTRRYWVLDAQRIRAPFDQVLRFIQNMAARWHPAKISIEQVQYQAAVVQELLRTTSLPVHGVKPDKDKLTRFQPLEARYEQGLVWHSTNLPREFEDELLSFPVGEHDDMVDALAYAYQSLGEQLPSAMWVDL